MSELSLEERGFASMVGQSGDLKKNLVVAGTIVGLLVVGMVTLGEQVGEARKWGLSRDDARLLGAYGLKLLPAPGDPEGLGKIELLKQIAPLARDAVIDGTVPEYENDKLIAFMRNGGYTADDLRWILSAGWKPFVASFVSDGLRVDWKRTREKYKDLAKLPLHILEAAGLPPKQWNKWEQYPKVRAPLVALSRFGERYGSRPFREVAVLTSSMNFGSLASLEEIEKRGELKRVVEVASHEGVYLVDSLLRLAREYLKYHDVLPSDWTSISELKEKLEEASALEGFGGDEAPDSVQNAAHNPAARAFDRAAREDLSWAAQQAPAEYQRGRRVSAALNEVVDQIVDMANRGEEIFIHGRDGELLYEMVKHRPNAKMKRIHYGVTSRAITTGLEVAASKQTNDYSSHVLAKKKEDIEAYLRRVVPPNAVHVDTGFAGSIPRHLASMGIPVKKVLMVSAVNPAEEFKISPDNLPSYGRREMVLADLEHSAQRLRAPRLKEWGKTGYSADAPGFWARLAGALGVKKP